jgi:hypothetical protein
MGQVTDWWLNRGTDDARQFDWELPISSVQRFRPVGGYLLGTATALEFIPNRFEARVGGAPWVTPLTDLQSVTLGRRRLQLIVTGAPTRTLYTNRPQALRRHLRGLLTSQA